MPLKILIVDDNLNFRRSLEKLLAMEGFQVVAAENLKQGHEKVDGQEAVILDLDLPDGCGIDLLKRMRREHHPAKVFVTSGSCDVALLKDVAGLQPDAVISKPINVSKLLRLLHADLPDC